MLHEVTILLEIVSYNLRLDTTYDGPQAFSYRKPYVLDRINAESPDLIGFQEVLPHTLDWLRENLSGYTVLGYGRGKDFSDEANPIAFKSDRFELQYFDQRWLSETPFEPGSRFSDQSGCPRVFAVCVLRDRQKDGAGRFRFVNTHLDHERDFARVEGAKLIINELARLNMQTMLPSIITGDFNATPDSAPLSVFKAAGYRDLAENSGATFHGYGKVSEECKIDYIMAPDRVYSSGCRLWTGTRDGLFLSDHHPVEAILAGWNI